MFVYPYVGGCDLAILVDTSKNIDENDLQDLLNFVTAVFHSFTLGNDVRYGLATFGGSVEVFHGNVFSLIFIVLPSFWLLKDPLYASLSLHSSNQSYLSQRMSKLFSSYKRIASQNKHYFISLCLV